jgi:hypothetical protein
MINHESTALQRTAYATNIKGINNKEEAEMIDNSDLLIAQQPALSLVSCDFAEHMD